MPTNMVSEPVVSDEAQDTQYPKDNLGSKAPIPLPLKVFGALCILGGAGLLLLVGTIMPGFIEQLNKGAYADRSATVLIVFIVMNLCLLVMTTFSVMLGIRLIRNKRHRAAQVIQGLVMFSAVAVVCDVMLFGLNVDTIVIGAFLLLLIALSGYLDPSLSEERRLQNHLRVMEDRSIAELGEKAGRDLTGKGYITLNFFNIFWIFVVCSIFGLLLETVAHFINYGEYQDRAGLLFGPFSPIYGFGGVLMTVALNRFHKKPIIVIFLVSALIGGVFEYFVSWFLQFSFGITAWDYTGSWLSIDGRTNGLYMITWGFLGAVWIKFLLPLALKLINAIPWQLRYALTAVAAALLIIDGAMTLMSFDFWFQREAGHTPQAPVEHFFAAHFDDAFMAERFQSMSINPTHVLRT